MAKRPLDWGSSSRRILAVATRLPPSPNRSEASCFLPALVVVFCAILGAACAQSAASLQRGLPIVAPAGANSTPNPEAVIAAATEGSSWWTALGDPGLNDAITRTLTYNRDLAVVASRISAAEAEARIAGSADLPNVDTGFASGRQRLNFIGLPIPGREGEVLTTTRSVVGLSLNMSWEPDLWGKLKSGKVAAAADVESTRAGLAAARLSLAGQTAKAWFAAVDAKRQVGVAAASVENRRIAVEAAANRLAGGVPSSLDQELARSDLKRAEANLERRRMERDATLRQLEILMGEYPDGEREIAEDLPPSPGPIPAGLNSSLVHRRPDLVAAEYQVLSSDARIAQSRAALRPSFGLTGVGGTLTNTLRQVVSGERLIWGMLGGVTQPLLDGGRLKGVVERNEAIADQARANYERSILQAYGEVETAIAADAVLASQEALLEDAMKRALTAQKLAEEKYRGGMADIATLLIAQRTALETESAWLSVRRSRFDHRIDLHLALGGDFEATVAQVAPADGAGGIVQWR